MTATKFKGGYIHKLTPDEIFSIHYVHAWPGEDIKKVFERVTKTWGCSEPAFLFNAELYDMQTGKPASSVVEKGKVHLLTEGHGIGFVGNKKPTWSYKNNVNAPDYVGVYPTLLRNGKKDFARTPSGLGGTRGRTAIAVDNQGNFYIALLPDSGGATLTELTDALIRAGAVNGGNLDGGGSSQWYSPAGSYYTGRKVRGYIAVWLNKPKAKQPEPKQDLDIRTVRVRTSLNVREKPSILSKVKGRLYNNDTVQVLETKPGWCRISAGWVSSLYLRKEG